MQANNILSENLHGLLSPSFPLSLLPLPTAVDLGYTAGGGPSRREARDEGYRRRRQRRGILAQWPRLAARWPPVVHGAPHLCRPPHPPTAPPSLRRVGRALPLLSHLPVFHVCRAYTMAHVTDLRLVRELVMVCAAAI